MITTDEFVRVNKTGKKLKEFYGVLKEKSIVNRVRTPSDGIIRIAGDK